MLSSRPPARRPRRPRRGEVGAARDGRRLALAATGGEGGHRTRHASACSIRLVDLVVGVAVGDAPARQCACLLGDVRRRAVQLALAARQDLDGLTTIVVVEALVADGAEAPGPG